MKSFAVFLLAATVSAVSLQGSHKGNKPIMLELPDFEPVDQKTLNEIQDVNAIRSPLEDLVNQIEEGFKIIDEHNDKAEAMTIDQAQQEQDSAIEEIMDEANDEVVEVIEDESDASDAADEIEEIMED